MNASTSLVQAYLHANGYFTATDYPLIETVPDNAPRALTDIDMLAVRFARSMPPHDKRSLLDTSEVTGPVTVQADPQLDCPADHTDMIVAEVKQGKAQVNPGARNRHALAATLTRFGCCNATEAPKLVRALLQDGRVLAANGHVIRMVLFASRGDRAPRGWHWVHLDGVVQFLDAFLREDGSALGAVDLHDPALNWLSLLHKCGFSLQHKRQAP